MPYTQCDVCKKEFYAKPSHQKKGWARCCSQECRNITFRRKIKVLCFYCGKNVEKTPSELKKSKSKKYFCDRSCQTKWRNNLFSGKLHSNWKGGISAYRKILEKSGLIRKCKRCGCSDRRILAVHHLDRNRNNNGVENLVWLCHNCHHLIHTSRGENKKFMVTLV